MGRPFPRQVARYFAGDIPFGYLNRNEREIVREYERDRKRRYRARKKRLLRWKPVSSGGSLCLLVEGCPHIIFEV